jgi:hypothetical protein
MLIATAALQTRGEASPWMEVASFTGDVVANALCGLGALALAQWHTGLRRRCIQLASLVWLGSVAAVFSALAAALLLWPPWPVPNGWAQIESYLWFAIAVLPAAWLALAAARRHGLLALAAVAVTAAAHPAPFTSEPIARLWSELPLRGFHLELARAGVVLLGVVLTAALALVLAPRGGSSEPGRAAAGLRRTGLALGVQIAATVVGIAPFALARQHSLPNPAELSQLAIAAAAALAAAGHAWGALGLLGAARDRDMPRVRIVLAAAASLWCSTAALGRFLLLRSANADYATDWLAPHSAMTAAVSLVSFAGVTLLAIAIGPLLAQHQVPTGAAMAGTFANFNQHYREQERRRIAVGQFAGIVAFMLAGELLPAQFLTHQVPAVADELIELAGQICSVVALLLLARLCSRVAAELDARAALPWARVSPTADTVRAGSSGPTSGPTAGPTAESRYREGPRANARA